MDFLWCFTSPVIWSCHLITTSSHHPVISSSHLPSSSPVPTLPQVNLANANTGRGKGKLCIMVTNSARSHSLALPILRSNHEDWPILQKQWQFAPKGIPVPLVHVVPVNIHVAVYSKGSRISTRCFTKGSAWPQHKNRTLPLKNVIIWRTNRKSPFCVVYFDPQFRMTNTWRAYSTHR